MSIFWREPAGRRKRSRDTGQDEQTRLALQRKRNPERTDRAQRERICKSQIPDSKKPALDAGFLVFGALDRIRTCDRSVRSRVLYPAELRVHLVLRIIVRRIFFPSTFSSNLNNLPKKPDYNVLNK